MSSITRIPYQVLIFLAIFSCKQNDSPESTHLFTLLTQDETGVEFSNTLTEGPNTNILMYEYFYNGAGIASGDFNNDGLIDLYFSSNMGDNKLYLNKGNMKFEDVTHIANVGGRSGPWKTGVNAVDINGDHKLDIYLCYSGALPEHKRVNQLFINVGNDNKGTPVFQESAATFGVASAGYSNQSYFVDYDRDGDLDMLLLNHNPKNLPIQNVEATAKMFREDNAEKGLRLFKQTNGRFEDVTSISGINGSELSYGLGLAISDINDDGWPDFYVSNDYSVPDFLYINNRNGTFTDQLKSNIGHTSQFSMGNDIADINNDALQDIITLDMLPEDNRRQKLLLSPDNLDNFNLNVRNGFHYQYMRNMLHLNNGNGSFSEIGQQAGISNTDWSWAALLADYDNDGWKDLYVTNGYLRDYTNLDFLFYMNNYVQEKGRLKRDDVMELVKQMPSSNVVNYIYRNSGNAQFENKIRDWGMNQTSNSNGAVYADLDNDGDLDLVVNNINQPAFIYRNEARNLNSTNYLQVKLVGDRGNTQGLGAKVKLYYGSQIQILEQNPTRGYLSSISPVLHFGLGNAEKIDSLRIIWNSGKFQTTYNVKVNQVLQLREVDAKDAQGLASVIDGNQQWFRKIPPAINYHDRELTINDFNRQGLLISQPSYTGPCMIKYDINGDKLEDILIGGGDADPTQIYFQQPDGRFVQRQSAAFDTDKNFIDADLAVFDANGDSYADIYVASGGYHQLKPDDPLLQDRLYINDGKNNFTRSNALPQFAGSKACVEIDDINGDGYLDAFVGGRLIPGRYPEIPRSYILINDGKGRFSDQTENICPQLVKPGMVTDAKWADLDGDKKNELVIVGEWMPILVFRKEKNKLVDVSDQFFDRSYAGWWNNIAAGDLNGDGKPDLVIGNLGLNTQCKASEKEPLEMYYKDFDENGSVDPIFSFYIQHQRYPYLTRDELLGQLPVLRKRFSDFKTYAETDLDGLFQNGELKAAGHLIANHLETSCFISGENGKLKKIDLPKEAQYSPVHGILLLDANNDGNTDVLLCGNNSHAKLRLGKFDANYGVLLRSDGKGSFEYVPQRESGFNICGDVRSVVQVNNVLLFGINGKPLATYLKNAKTTPPKVMSE